VLEIKIKRNLPGFNLDVGFSVDNGILSIMGPSGSGKTMTLQCIAGLVRPDEGYIKLNDRVIFDSSSRINLPARVRKVGFVFQNYALFPHLSVKENIAYGIRDLFRQERDKRVSELLSIMHIEKLRDHSPRQLSSGEQQRVALARALAPRPEVLLLDEPFSALDILHKEGLELELLSVQRSFKGSILFVTHDFSQGYSLGSRIAIYESGRIMQCDIKNKVVSSPANSTVARLMGLKNLLTGYVSKLNDSEVSVTVPGLIGDIKSTRNSDAVLKTGQPVTVGIRPENFRMVANGGENTFSGSIEQVVEGLTSFNYSVRLNTKEDLGYFLFATMSKSDVISAQENQSCKLYVSPENVIIMPDSTVG
jgi:molybdate transport system ATP-binding protein